MELVANNVSCIRGTRVIFQGLSFRVGRGETLGLVGPNGTGKTSLLRIIAGFLNAASGSVMFEGSDDTITRQEQCHYVGHSNGIKPQFTVGENLRFYKTYFGGSGVKTALDQFSLSAIEHIPAGLLSAGQKRRVGLARLSIVPRPIWLLDEPSVSLDQQSVRLLADLIRRHVDGGGMVIAATHVPLGVEFSQTLDMGTLEVAA